MKDHDEFGRELNDQTPLEVPLGRRNKDPYHVDNITALIRREISAAAKDLGFETLEEADDFDIADEEDPLSQYEMSEMQEEEPIIRPTEQDPPPAEPEPPKQEADDPAVPAKSLDVKDDNASQTQS